MMQINRILIFFLTFGAVVSCREVNGSVIGGAYASDKFIPITEGAEFGRTRLVLHPNGSFNLTEDSATLAEGSWTITESAYREGNSGRTEPQAKVEFSFDNKKIIGEFRGSIFYFADTNNFQPDVYRYIIYVKLKK